MADAINSLWTVAAESLSEAERKCIDFDNSDHKLAVLSDLQKLTRQSRDDCVRKRWKCSFKRRNGETVILRDLFSKLVFWVDKFIAIGNTVVSYDPVHAALPWAGVKFLLQIAVSNIKKFDFVVEGAENIARTIDYCAVFERLYLSGQSALHQSLRQCLIRVYAAILKYLASAKRYFEKSSLNQFAGSLLSDTGSFDSINDSITLARDESERYATLIRADAQKDISNGITALSIESQSQRQMLTDILDEIRGPVARPNILLDSIAENLEERERKEILDWISTQPHPDHHSQVFKYALKGTGQWLLQHPLFCDWMQSSISSLLWVHGTSGTGKSTLLSIAVEDALNNHKIGTGSYPAYFYCSRNPVEPERSQPRAILASIMRQLSTTEPAGPLLQSASTFYKDRGSFGGHASSLITEDSCNQIIKLCESRSLTIIVIDALDECERDSRHELLDSIEKILEDSNGLTKILVSSRDDADLVYGLKTYPSVAISSERNSNDIENFIKMETELRIKRGRLLRNSTNKEALRDMIVETLIKGANGMFRWAAMQLEALCQLKLDTDIRERLGKLPLKLKTLYDDIYTSLQNDAGENGRRIIRNVFSWLLYAQETIQISEFLVAVSYNPGNAQDSNTVISIDTVLDICSNLVVYDANLKIFRFAHASVLEYLQGRPEYSQELSNAFIAEFCLVLIIGERKPRSLVSSITEKWRYVDYTAFLTSNFGGTLGDMISSRARIWKPWPPLGCMEYAWYYLGFHCKISQNGRNQGNLKLALDFFFNDYEYLRRWFQWYCVSDGKFLQRTEEFKMLSKSIGVLQNLFAKVRSTPCRHLLIAFYLSSYFKLDEIVMKILQRTVSCFENHESSLLLILVTLDPTYAKQVQQYITPDLVVNMQMLVQMLLHLPAMVESPEHVYPLLVNLRKSQQFPLDFLDKVISGTNFMLKSLILPLVDVKFGKMAMMNLPRANELGSAENRSALGTMMKPNRVIEIFGHKFDISPDLLMETALHGCEAQMLRLLKRSPGLNTELFEKLVELSQGRNLEVASALFRMVFYKKPYLQQQSKAKERILETENVGTLDYHNPSWLKGVEMNVRILKMAITITPLAVLSEIIFRHGGLKMLSEECLLAMGYKLNNEKYIKLIQRVLRERQDLKLTARFLEEALSYPRALLVEILDLFGGPISDTVLVAAFEQDEKHRVSVLETIIRRDTTHSLTWNRDLEEAVAGNFVEPLKVLKLLEDALGPLEISHDLMVDAAAGSSELMIYFLTRRPEFYVSEDLLVAAARTHTYSRLDDSIEKLKFLLGREHRDQVSESALLATLDGSGGFGIKRKLKLLLSNVPSSFQVSVNFLLAVARHSDCYDIMKVLQEFKLATHLIMDASSADLLSIEASPLDDRYRYQHGFDILGQLKTRTIESHDIEDAVRLAASKGFPNTVGFLTRQFHHNDLRDKYAKIAKLHEMTNRKWFGSYKWDRFELEALMRSAEDFDLPDPAGKTPLYKIIPWGATDYAELLLDRGANPCQETLLGDTPLIRAAVYDNFLLVPLLLKYHTHCPHADECVKRAAAAADLYYNFQMAEYLKKLVK